MIKVLTQRKWVIIFILFLPILFSLISISLQGRTSEEVKIPVVLVDPYNQEITNRLLEDMDIHDSFIITKAKRIPEEKLIRGEIEAAFVLPQKLKEKIHSGDLKNEIIWYRHERSLFDGLFKEQLASAIVKKAVRAEAANIVKNYQEDANWEDIYEFGLQYLEPEPIFQIQFQHIKQETYVDTAASDEWLMIRWLYWVVLWVVIARLTQMLLDWKEQLILDRLKILGVSKKMHLSWILFFVILLSGITLLTSSLMQYFWLDAYQMLDMVIDLALVLIAIMVYFILTLFVKRKETLWMVSFSYGVTSSIVFFLMKYELLTDQTWLGIFLPSWILF